MVVLKPRKIDGRVDVERLIGQVNQSFGLHNLIYMYKTNVILMYFHQTEPQVACGLAEKLWTRLAAVLIEGASLTL